MRANCLTRLTKKIIYCGCKIYQIIILFKTKKRENKMPINSNWRLEAISKAALAYTRRSFTLKNGTNKVGKSSKDNIRCPSFLCSRNHCKITVENDQLMVLDTVSIVYEQIIFDFLI